MSDTHVHHTFAKNSTPHSWFRSRIHSCTPTGQNFVISRPEKTAKSLLASDRAHQERGLACQSPAPSRRVSLVPVQIASYAPIHNDQELVTQRDGALRYRMSLRQIYAGGGGSTHSEVRRAPEQPSEDARSRLLWSRRRLAAIHNRRPEVQSVH